MGRKRDAVWGFFNDPIESDQRKVKRASCKYCNGLVTGTTTNLKAHVLRCDKVPADHGIIPPPAVLKARRHSMLALGSAGSTSSAPLLSAIGNAAVSSGLKAKLDAELSSAIHRSCLPFDILHTPAWRQFFATLRPDYTLPSPQAIGSSLLDAEYAAIMTDCKGELAAAGVAVMGLQAVSKTMANVFVHSPGAWFMHTLHAGVHDDPAMSVAEKVKHAIERTKQFVETEFTVAGFVSDSSENMCQVRELLLKQGVVSYAYGCSLQPLNLFCRDVLSREPFRQLVKKAVFVSKTVKLDETLSALFESMCFEKMLSSQRMVLYSRDSWSSCNSMFSRLFKTKVVLTMLPIRLLHDREARGIDAAYELPADFFASVSSSKFWNTMETATRILDPICFCIEALSADQATLSLTYAVFIYLSARLADPTDGLGLGAHAKELRASLLERWARVYSPVHALAFFCDPLFFGLRARVSEHFPELLELGQGPLRVQCERALPLLAGGNEHLEAQLAAGFGALATGQPQHASLVPDRERSASSAWAEAGDAFPVLGPALVRLFRASTTAGAGSSVEANQMVRSAARASVGADRAERQAAIAHNSAHAARVAAGSGAPVGRAGGFETVIAAYGSEEAGLVLDEFLRQRELTGQEEEKDEEEEVMLRRLQQTRCIDEIEEEMLFAVDCGGES